jgi:spore coat polysaccharide biosynthesis protein SpsF (cytidylyltransferase family)
VKVVGIVVGRMGSARLPGKVMLPFAGHPSMLHCYWRLKACYPVSQVWFMPTDDPTDSEIIQLAESLGEPYIIRPNKGMDVAGGLLQVHKAADADLYLEVSCDSPLSETVYAREVIDAYLDGATYVHKDDPDMTWLATTSIIPVGHWEMEQHKTSSSPYFREHPGSLMQIEVERLRMLDPSEITIVTPTLEEKAWKRPYRVQVDEYADAYVMASIYGALFTKPIIDTRDALTWCDTHPEVMRYNSQVVESMANLSGYTLYEKAKPEKERIMHAVVAAKDSRNHLQYCQRCGLYLGYAREERGRHKFYTFRGIQLSERAAVTCTCGASREWYGGR